MATREDGGAPAGEDHGDHAETGLRPLILATLGLGGVMLAGVGLVGDMWLAASTEVKGHINSVVSVLFFTLQANLAVLVLALAFYRRLGRLRMVLNGYGVVMFLIGIYGAGIMFDRVLHSGADAPALDAFVPPGFEFAFALQGIAMIGVLVWGVVSLFRR